MNLSLNEEENARRSKPRKAMKDTNRLSILLILCPNLTDAAKKGLETPFTMKLAFDIEVMD